MLHLPGVVALVNRREVRRLPLVPGRQIRVNSKHVGLGEDSVGGIDLDIGRKRGLGEGGKGMGGR